PTCAFTFTTSCRARRCVRVARVFVVFCLVHVHARGDARACSLHERGVCAQKAVLMHDHGKVLEKKKFSDQVWSAAKFGAFVCCVVFVVRVRVQCLVLWLC